MANFYAFYPPGGGTSNPSVGTTGTTAPTSATEVGGINPSGDLEALQLDGSGNLYVNINGSGGSVNVNTNITEIVGSPPSSTNSLPTQLTDGTSFYDARQIRALTSSDVVTADQGGTWNIDNITGTVSLPTGAATAANQATANTALSNIEANQTNGTQVTTITGTVPLPAGAATAGNQTDGSQKSQIVDSSGNVITSTSNALNVSVQGTTPISGTVTVDQGTSPWVTSASQSGTWDINNITGTVSLPTGASTSALQTSGNASLSSIDSKTPALGQAAMAASVPVAIASDQSVISIAQKGLNSSNAPVQNVYSSTNITTSAYTQLIASTASATSYIDIFDSSGQAMILATGGSGSEVIQAYIPPGGDSFSFSIPASTRVAYKALTANATSGYLLLNLRG